MARLTRQSNSAIMIAAAVLLLLGVFQFRGSRPLHIDGVVLDASMALQEESTVLQSDAPLSAGDRLVGVDQAPVRSLEELTLVLLRAQSTTVEGRFRQQDSEETVTVTATQLLTNPPTLLLDGPDIVAIRGDSVSGEIDMEALVFMAERESDGSIDVTVRVPGTTVRGRMEIVRGGPPVPGLIPIILGFMGLGALVVRRKDDDTGAQNQQVAVTAFVLGAAASSSSVALVFAPSASPRFLVWAFMLLLAWRACSALLHERMSGHTSALRSFVIASPGIVSGVAGIALLATSLGGHGLASWSLDAHDYMVAATFVLALYALAEGVRFLPNGWAPNRPVATALAVSAAAVVCGAVAAGVGQPSLASAAIAASAVCLWGADYLATMTLENVAIAQVEGTGGVVEVLNAVAEVSGGRPHAVVAGVDGQFFVIEAVDVLHDGELRPQLRPADEALGVAIGMLAAEQQSIVATGNLDPDENDPFADLPTKLGIDAALPIDRAASDAVVSYIVLWPDELGEARDLNVVKVREAVNAHAGQRFAGEVITLVAERILLEVRKQRARAAAADKAPAKVAGEVATVTEDPPDTKQSGGSSAWIEHLQRVVAREFPVEDPDALADDEWRALDPLARSDRPCLILGAPGVGKEFMARAIHFRADRPEQRVAVFDCATTPAALVALELFGDEHEEGLATLVAGGSLVIRNASILDVTTLDVLCARLGVAEASIIFLERHDGVGEEQPTWLPQQIREIVDDRWIRIATLNSRRDDIERYARFFLHRASMRYDCVVVGFEDDAIEALKCGEYPANIRDLHAIVRAAVLSAGSGTVSVADLAVGKLAVAGQTRTSRRERPDAGQPRNIDVVRNRHDATDADTITTTEHKSDARDARVSTGVQIDLGDDVDDPSDDDYLDLPESDQMSLDDLDLRSRVVHAMEQADGNKSAAARELGMSRGKFLRTLQRFGLM